MLLRDNLTIDYVDMLNQDILCDYPAMLTVDDLREILNIGRNRVYQLLKEEQIRSLTIRGKYRIPKIFLTEYIMNNCCEVAGNRI